MNSGYFETVPITIVYLGITVIILVSIELGFRVGDKARRDYDKEAPISIGPLVGGLLSMLGFVLVISYSVAASLNDSRKQYVLEEANTISTAYLRADLLDRKIKSEVKRLLKEYVDARLQAISPEHRADSLKKSLEIHKQLWSRAAAISIQAPSHNTQLFVQSINDLIDLHQKRVTVGARARIPSSIWLALTAISALTMVTLGIQLGMSRSRRLVAIIPMSLAFAVLVTLIVDLDRPQSGMTRVSQDPMLDLQANIYKNI